MSISFSTRSRSNNSTIFSKIISIGGVIAITSVLYFFESRHEFIINFLTYIILAMLSYVLIIFILRYLIRKQSNPDVAAIVNFPFTIISILFFVFSILSIEFSSEYVPYLVTILYVIIFHHFNYWYILSNMHIKTTFISNPETQVKLYVFQPIFFRFLIS